MSFINSQGFKISGGQFNHVEGDQYQSADPILLLWQTIKDVGASHNSETRYPPPKCHPDTRRRVLNVIRDWIHSESPEDCVFWLYGPAGAGKSAIAQTIAESGQQEGYLVSSFFFLRSDVNRNTARSLFLTMAYGLAITIPELREPIGQEIQENPAILQASLDEQFEKLIVEPCMVLERPDDHPWLIIVDGLDECSAGRSASQEQQRILFIVARAAATLMRRTRLRFLICSRPEPLIREAFDTDAFRQVLHRVALDSTFEPGHDIAIFLNAEFIRIRTGPQNYHIQFPVPWPARGIIHELVQKASGQFIYAATVVKFIDNEYANPCKQLETVLHPGPHPDPESESPFSDLDVLYHQILSSNPRHSKLREIVRSFVELEKGRLRIPGDLICQRLSPRPQHIEALLILADGDVITALRGMHSILNIRGPGSNIHTYHASFGDFLRDAQRSGYFFVGNEQDQCSFLTCRLLRAFDHYFKLCGGDENMLSWAQGLIVRAAWYNWGLYFSYSNSDDVLHALSNVMVDFTQSLSTYIGDYLTSWKQLAMVRIQAFFSQTCLLLLKLQGIHVDITRRFSDIIRGFCVRVSRTEVFDEANLPEMLDDTARLLAYGLLKDNSMSEAIQRKLSGFWLEHCQIVSIGNDCSCTRAKEASSRLSLPCSEPPSGDVYHIQVSAAMRNIACMGMDRLGGLKKYGQHLRDVVFEIEHIAPYETLWLLLEICGPSPKFLESFHLSEIRARDDQSHVLRWLQSFPSDYTSRISPLIEQVQAINFDSKLAHGGIGGPVLKIANYRPSIDPTKQRQGRRTCNWESQAKKESDFAEEVKR